MKDLFPGYCKKTPEELKELWGNAIIYFDANVILSLYRYSVHTKMAILDLIKKFDGRIWLPHQAALEYHRHRYEVIAEQEKAYNKFLERIDGIKKELQNTNKPPFLSNKVTKSLDKSFDQVEIEVNESIARFQKYLKTDPIHSDLIDKFKEKITGAFTLEELEIIFKEGKSRYESQIPPGYKDNDKSGNNKYGDLVLWKQLIAEGKKHNKPIILITDDTKEDWWWKIKDGRTMGPRHELVAEMKSQANVEFHMYSSFSFLNLGLEYFKEEENKQALLELEELRKKHKEIEKADQLNFQNIIQNALNVRAGDEIDDETEFLKKQIHRLRVQ